MNREEGMELVQRSIDGDLNEEETSRLQAYLLKYPECAAFKEKLTRLSEELTQLPHVAPRYSLVDAILPQLDRIVPEPAPGTSEAAASESPYEPRARRSGERRTGYRRLGAVVAAGVVAAVLIIAQPFSLPKSDQDKSASMAETMNQSAPAGAEASSGAASGQRATTDQEMRMEISDVAGAEAGQGAAKDAPTAKASGGSNEGGTGSKPSANDSASEGLDLQAPVTKFTKSTSAAGEAPSPSAATRGAEGGSSGSSQGHQGFAPPAVAANPDPAATNDPSADGPVVTEGTTITGVPDMAFSSSSAESSWPSPDGSLTALAVDGGIRIVQTDGMKTVFESGSREGSISDVTWGQNGQDLYYTWTDASGKSTDMRWSAADNREYTR